MRQIGRTLDYRQQPAIYLVSACFRLRLAASTGRRVRASYSASAYRVCRCRCALAGWRHADRSSDASPIRQALQDDASSAPLPHWSTGLCGCRWDQMTSCPGGAASASDRRVSAFANPPFAADRALCVPQYECVPVQRFASSGRNGMREHEIRRLFRHGRCNSIRCVDTYCRALPFTTT